MNVFFKNIQCHGCFKNAHNYLAKVKVVHTVSCIYFSCIEKCSRICTCTNNVVHKIVQGSVHTGTEIVHDFVREIVHIIVHKTQKGYPSKRLPDRIG